MFIDDQRYTHRSMRVCVCVFYVYLVSSDEVFPFALALLSASAVTLLFHSGRNHLPQNLITLRLHEIRVEFGPDHQEIPGFLNTPLRKPIAAAGVGARGGARVLVVELRLLMMMPLIHIYKYNAVRWENYWGRKGRFGGKEKTQEKEGFVVLILYEKGGVKIWCENQEKKRKKKRGFLNGKRMIFSLA